MEIPIFKNRDLFFNIYTKVKLSEPPPRSIGTQTKLSQSKKYKAFILDAFNTTGIAERAEDLYGQALIPRPQNSTTFINQLNEIDKEITDILVRAEKKHGASPLKQQTMNSEVNQWQLLIQYWRVRICEVKTKVDMKNNLTGIHMNLDGTKQALVEKYATQPVKGIRKAKEKLLIAQNEAIQALQEEENLECSLIAAAEGLKTKGVEGRRQHIKQSRALFQRLKTSFKPAQSQGICQVLIPEASGSPQYETVTDPVRVETLLIERNQEHFSQAQGSPFTVAPLSDTFGYKGETMEATQLIRGHNSEHIIKKQPIGVQSILRKLNDNKALPLINADLTYSEFVAGFRTWREATSTSPSGRHLGHYKTLLRAEENEDKTSNKDQPVKKFKCKNPIGQKILTVIFHIAMAALRAGETLDRWTTVASMMIEKDPGISLISRLRVIHIYEADYNLLLKILWARKLTWNAHDRDAIHPAQAGGRPGRKAIDVVVYKENKYLYSRLTRTALATLDNDAKSCYDRIICNLAMLVSRYHGMPLHACSTQAKTLEQIRYHLKTALGISKKFYSHSNTTPVHGSGQGSCASPNIWLLISSILMQCLDLTVPGMLMHGIQKDDEVIQSNIDGFVDDTSIFVNLPFQDQSLKELCASLQHATQTWSELLTASGGKLELPKCFYYILSWRFTSDGDPVAMTTEQQAEVSNTVVSIIESDKSSNESQIKQKEPTSSHKTLGVFKTMVGDESTHFTYLLDKSNKLAMIAASARMSRKHAQMAYSMLYMPALTYSLAACSFSEGQMNKIQKKSLNSFLPAMGICRTSSRAVVHGPFEYGGMKVGHLYTAQCASKLQTLVTHIRANSELGKLLITNINWIQLTSGQSEHFFLPQNNISYIPENWFTHIKEFINTIGVQIQTTLFWIPHKARLHDQCIMEI